MGCVGKWINQINLNRFVYLGNELEFELH